MAVQELSNGNPDGARVGSSATELVSFHGADPVAQAAVATAVPAAVTLYSASTADFTTLVTTVNAMRTILINKGFMAAS
jgi:hypothetical protein